MSVEYDRQFQGTMDHYARSIIALARATKLRLSPDVSLELEKLLALQPKPKTQLQRQLEKETKT